MTSAQISAVPYLIRVTECHHFMRLLSQRVSANLVKYRARARYFYDTDGVRRLHSIQFSSHACFGKDGWELQGDDDSRKKLSPEQEEKIPEGRTGADSSAKSRRRARKEVFELALCNPDLNAFFTLTFSPEAVKDRGSYDEVYKEVKTWFSNRVQRKGLKYILVPERHKKGGIHFHGFCNAEALRLVAAVNPHTGLHIVDKGRAVYNIEDWSRLGFSTCKVLPPATEDRIKAAKYVTKYITKASEKIGGRYLLHGGALRRWEYEYGESAEDLTYLQPRHWWYKEGDGFSYTEYTYM